MPETQVAHVIPQKNTIGTGTQASQQSKNNRNFYMTDSFKSHSQTSAIKTREVNQSTFPVQYPPTKISESIEKEGRKWINKRQTSTTKKRKTKKKKK
jgi:hypothetical protein